MNISLGALQQSAARSTWLIGAALLLSSAAGGQPVSERRSVSSVRGYLVDMVCVREEAGKLLDLGPKHSRKCLQMPACVESGYSVLLPSNKVLRLDAHGNDLTRRMLRVNHRDTGWLVKVTGVRQGDGIAVHGIELVPVAGAARKVR